MTDTTNMHAPTPEFRAALEEDIVRAFSRTDLLVSPLRSRGGRRVRTAFAVAAGLILGVGTNFAAGQVQDSRQRDTLTIARNSELLVMKARLDLAQAAYDQTRKMFDAGMVGRASLVRDESELRALQGALARLELDMEEIRASAAPPRDDLWAPLIGGRDFVKERLSIEAATAQARLSIEEAAKAEADKAFRAGVITQLALAAAQMQSLAAQGELEALARKMALRAEFIKGGTTDNQKVDALTRSVKRLEIEMQLKSVERELTLAQTRVGVARERYAIGAASEVDYKRAELDVLERTLQLQKLRLALTVLDRGGK